MASGAGKARSPGILIAGPPQVNPRVKRSSFMSGITLNQALKLALLWHIPWCQLSHPPLCSWGQGRKLKKQSSKPLPDRGLVIKMPAGHGPRGPPATGAKKVARQVAGSSVENKAWFWNWNPFSLMEASHFKFGNLEKNLTWGSWSFKTQDSEICFSALSNFGYQSCHASKVLH